jgi:arylsulfatase A-like enzyme
MASPTSPATPPAPGGLLVFTIDRLPAWMLPAWGATWVSMPNLDALGGRGLVFDRLLATSLDPRETLLAFAADGGLWREAAAAGWPAAVVTDEPSLPDVAPGVERIEVPAAAVAGTAAVDDETNAARLCARARELIAAGRHRLVWCHMSGLAVAWDAPDAFREGYVDPDDPPPPPGARVPHFTAGEETDPDLVVGIRQVFAGQLTLLDRCLGQVLEAAATAGWAVLLTGLRGMPLGLHGVVGCERGNPPGGLPYGEWAQLPAILVDAAGRMAGQRYGGLVVPAEIGATLVDIVAGHRSSPTAQPARLAGLVDSWSAPARDRVIIDAGEQAAIVTDGWHFVASRPHGGGERPARLFAKPDDYFELSDVANRCAAVADELERALEPVWRGDIPEAYARSLSIDATSGQ